MTKSQPVAQYLVLDDKNRISYFSRNFFTYATVISGEFYIL